MVYYVCKNNYGYYIRGNMGKYYGNYSTYKEALEKVKKLVDSGILRVPVHERPLRYIQPTASGHWTIRKTINGERHTYGTYKTLEDAQHERDYLEQIGWDYDNM